MTRPSQLPTPTRLFLARRHPRWTRSIVHTLFLLAIAGVGQSVVMAQAKDPPRVERRPPIPKEQLKDLEDAAQVDDEALASLPSEQRGPTPEQRELAKKIAKLAEMLDSDRRVERDTAEATILQIGSAALEYLPTTSPDASKEWIMRIDRIREVLEKKQSDELSQASTVTLAGHMKAIDAIKKISQRTGNTIQLDEAASSLQKEIDVDFEESTFWEAIDEILDDIGMTIATGDSASIALIARAPNAPLRSIQGAYAGAFRIEPVSIDKTMQLIQPESSHATIHLAVAWEPRINPALIRLPLDQMELICDNGEIMSARPQDSEFVPIGGSQILFPLEFQLPSRNAIKVFRWNVKMQVTIPGRMASAEFTDLTKANNVAASIGSLSITLEKVRKNRDLQEVLVGIALKDANQTIESFRGWSSSNEAYLVAPDGKRIESVGWSTMGMAKQSAHLSYLFDIEGELDGYQFVYRAPGAVVAQEVEFILEDIPLP